MGTISTGTARVLALSMLRGVGPATLRKVAALPRFLERDVEDLAEQVPALSRGLGESDAWMRASASADEQVVLAERHDARILSALDAEYPALLTDSRDDPYVLYVRGTLAPEPLRSVAVIGTRQPTAHGLLIAERVSRYFVERGWSVVSGLALGCDAAAHRATLESGGHTVALLAHGLHTVAPAAHRPLADDILDGGGALVSQYPFGQRAAPRQFVQRDKTQAGMAQGVVMVQSDLAGGSLHASRAALAYGRWLAVPCPTRADRERGEPKVEANRVLTEGASAEQLALLQASEARELKNVIVLRTREDYAKCIDKSEPSEFGEVGKTASLL